MLEIPAAPAAAARRNGTGADVDVRQTTVGSTDVDRPTTPQRLGPVAVESGTSRGRPVRRARNTTTPPGAAAEHGDALEHVDVLGERRAAADDHRLGVLRGRLLVALGEREIRALAVPSESDPV